MRAGGRPKSYSNGARWISAGGGRKRKAKKEQNPTQETDPDIAYDSDGDGKADLIGWILHAPAPVCPQWFANLVGAIIIIYIALKYS